MQETRYISNHAFGILTSKIFYKSNPLYKKPIGCFLKGGAMDEREECLHQGNRPPISMRILALVLAKLLMRKRSCKI